MVKACAHDCRNGSECRTREACDLGRFAIRILRPGFQPLRYESRAPSSIDALVKAGDAYGWDARISARSLGR